MISMYLRPDKTQILQANIEKNGKFTVVDALETDAILDALLTANKDEKALEQLSNYFESLKKNSDIANEDVFIVLPDYLFLYIESIEYTNDANLHSLIHEKTGTNPDSLYITMPVETSSPAPERKSVYAIRRVLIDMLTSVCTRERIALTSVEPASLSFFRAYGKFDEEMPVVEVFDNNASIVTYSPAGGIFITDVPSFSIKEIMKNGPTADQMIQGMYASNDFAAGETFKNVNTDMPYIVLTENKKILEMPSIRFRLPETVITFPDFVQTYGIAKDQEVDWMIALGTLFQEYDEMKGDNEQKYSENPALANKPSFIRISSGNLLPPEAKQAARARQWKQVILHTCKLLSIGFGLCILGEISLAGYFSTYHVNQSLQNDYKQAKTDLKDIQDEINIIKEAKKADLQIPRAFGTIAQARPDGCGFEHLTIGNNNLGDDDTKALNDFVQLSAIAADEMVFQTFRSNLSVYDDLFTGPSLNSIQLDSSGYKKAAMTIGRKVSQ